MLESDYSGPVIDCYVHHCWAAPTDILEHMSTAWRQYYAAPIDGIAKPLTLQIPFHAPQGDWLPMSAPPGGGPPGSDPGFLLSQLADGVTLARVLLVHGAVRFVSSDNNPHAAAEVVRAANDWCVGNWLDGRDDRLFGAILVQNQLPERAAAEIRRIGAHPRMVAVLMDGNGLGRPYGHLLYHQIYEAAVEFNLPIVVCTGGDAVADTATQPASAGPPATYTEYKTLAAQTLATHVASFVGQGVFEKFPQLRVILAGGGVAWIPSIMWRMDATFKATRRDIPWVKQLPSDYFRKHIRLVTYPFDRPRRWQQLIQLLDGFGAADSLLCYGSGYPSSDADSIREVSARLPVDWQRKVFWDNPDALFRWPQ